MGRVSLCYSIDAPQILFQSSPSIFISTAVGVSDLCQPENAVSVASEARHATMVATKESGGNRFYIRNEIGNTVPVQSRTAGDWMGYGFKTDDAFRPVRIFRKNILLCIHRRGVSLDYINC